MAKADWESRKTDQRTAKNADQTEFLAVKYGSCALDEGVRDDRTADAMGISEQPGATAGRGVAYL